MLPASKVANYCFMYGCPVKFGVKRNTKMMLDIRNVLVFEFNKKTLACVFPAIFDKLVGRDSNFEIVGNQTTMQELELRFSMNLVANSHATIFVTTQLDAPPQERQSYRPLPALIYPGAEEEGKRAKRLFKEHLKFDTVELIPNPTKADMIAKYDEL